MATKSANTFGPTITQDDGITGKDYPAEMRTQLWPLCCGAMILSGFKNVQTLTEEQLVKRINDTISNMIPDLQVFGYETIRPTIVFLTLNRSQMDSPKIMNSITACGFVKIGIKNNYQGFFVKDMSNSFTTEPVKNGKALV